MFCLDNLLLRLNRIKIKNFESSINFLLLHLIIGESENKMTKKVLYTLEFPVKCSPGILYEFLATPAGLQEWFADKVDERDGIYYFNWNGSEDKAEFLEKELDKFIRFRWAHSQKEEFFEFRIEKTEISNQTILVIKDFADKKEVKDQSRLWEYQIKDLFHRLGSSN